MQSAQHDPWISTDSVVIDGYRRFPETSWLTPEQCWIVALVAEELEVSEDGMSLEDLIEAVELDKDALIDALEGIAEGLDSDGAPTAPMLNVFSDGEDHLRFTLTDEAWRLLRSTTH